MTATFTGTPTISIVRRELDRIERATGYRPDSLFISVYIKAYNEYAAGSCFDIEGFEIYISCLADSFIDSVMYRQDSVQHKAYFSC